SPFAIRQWGRSRRIIPSAAVEGADCPTSMLDCAYAPLLVCNRRPAGRAAQPGRSSMKVEFVDTTLRDGSQSLWASGMRSGMMTAVAEDLDKVGFKFVEIPTNSIF